MVSNLFIFIAGLITTGLCVLFVVYSARELKRLGRESDERIAGQTRGF